MHITKPESNFNDEPLRSEFRPLLVLIALAPFGLLIWTALFLAVQWSLLAVWAHAVALIVAA
jgi:hypothetical protein